VHLGGEFDENVRRNVGREPLRDPIDDTEDPPVLPVVRNDRAHNIATVYMADRRIDARWKSMGHQR
jgi:hypothetical protein